METLGELVKKWREEAGLNRPQMARLIGHGVKYQNLQQLENGVGQPKYLTALASFMCTTVDDLLALKMPPPYKKAERQLSPAPPEEAIDTESADTLPGNLDAPIARDDLERRLLKAFRHKPREERRREVETMEERARELEKTSVEFLRTRFGITGAISDQQVLEGFRRAGAQRDAATKSEPTMTPTPKPKTKSK